jgi:thiosulfate reductase cytochrome b subunit
VQIGLARECAACYDAGMGDSVWISSAPPAVVAETTPARHSALVRITHWLTTICFLALLVTGVEILISHPRFYWGEAGNVNMTPLFKIPIPASRSTVPTGYGYVLPDQNGWSRYLHFQAAWLAVLTGLLYGVSGFFSGHFRKDLLPGRDGSYNLPQRLTYLVVIFVLFPLVIWTGLAMSPAIASAFPGLVAVLGGQQSARTIHFFVSVFLFIFLIVHVVMISRAGFSTRMRGMITGGTSSNREQRS